jgi:hypothetical protein
MYYYYSNLLIPMDMVLWLDPSDASTRTMNDTIGTNLKSLRDKSKNALSAENLTSGTSQPTLGTLNGRTAINFNGANSQFLNLGQPAILNFDITTASHTVFVVARSGETTGVIIGRGDASSTFRSQLSQNTTTGIHSSWGGTVSTGVTYTRNITNVLCWKTNPTTHAILQNAVQIATASSGTNSLSVDLIIGARRNSANTGIALPYTGLIGEIIWYKRALSDTEILQVNNYLNNKWRKTGKLLVVGASLENGMYPGLQKLINTTYNVDWTTVDLAVGGEDSTDIKSRIDADLATYGERGTYAMNGAGGNNVSNTRPYSTATTGELATLDSDMDYIYDAIRTAGMQVLPCNLSFRTYDGITNYYPEDGSKPYNDNILQAKCAVEAPNFCYPDGTPFLDMYRFVQENVNEMIDEVHLSSTGYANYRQFIVDTVIKKIITGESPTQYSALPVPATPVLGALTPNPTSITATWTMSNETNVVGYAVEYKLTSDSTWTRWSSIVTAPTKTVTITGLPSSTNYDVRVKAATNTTPSNFSNVQTASTLSATILTDTFTDADNTDITAHTSDSGHSWVEQNGYSPSQQARVISNRLMPRSSLNVYRANLTMPNANYEVQAVLNVLSNTGSIGVTARASSTESTFYYWRYSSNQWALIERVAGTETTLGTFSQTLTAGQTVTVKIVCNGTTIAGWVDGVLRATATNSDITGAGSPGLRAPVSVTSTTGIHVDSVIARLI